MNLLVPLVLSLLGYIVLIIGLLGAFYAFEAQSIRGGKTVSRMMFSPVLAESVVHYLQSLFYGGCRRGFFSWRYSE